MPRLTIVRHGQASFGADDYDKLSDIGEKQSDIVGRWFADCDYRPARIVTGSLLRQRETADHCLAAMGVERVGGVPRLVDPRLDEFDNHEIFHVHLPALSAPHAMRAHLATQADPVRASREMFFAAMERWTANERPGDYRESWPAFNQRCNAAFVAAADGLPDDAEVLVFSSGGVISSLCLDILGLTPRVAFEMNWGLANTGVSVVNARKGRFRLASLNSVGHLEQSREGALITYR